MKYWEDWKCSQANPTVDFKFSDDKNIKGMLSDDKHAEGWKASLAKTDKVKGLELCSRVVM